MSVCAGVNYYSASFASNQGKLSIVNSSYSSISPHALRNNVRSCKVAVQHVPVSSSQCSLNIAATENSVPLSTQDSSLSHYSSSENSLSEHGGHETKQFVNETEYIESLAVEIEECIRNKSFAAGAEVHSRILEDGLECDRYLSNLLMLMYGNCGCIDAAEVIFQRMPFPNIYSANIMIKVYVTNYELETAKCFFDAMQERNAASWNAIISALTKSGHGKEALQYYHQMLAEGFQPNIITCVSAIDACADERSLLEGMKLHSTALAYGFFDMIVGTALINMYGQCGHLESAWQVHRQITQHDVLSWTAMIAACVHNGCSAKALDMFNQMPERDLAPTTSTFLSVLDGCGSLGDLPKCYKIHAQILSANVIADIRVENALINMYGRCQVPEDATIMFNRMLNRNTVTWSTMIAVFSQNKKNKEAIELFYQMQKFGANPNNYTVSMILDVCTAMESLEEGQSIYNHSVLAGIELDFIAAIAIINMYGKFGRPSDARVVFRSVEGGVLLWNALMSAYAINGYADEAHQIFEEMKLKGVKPNKASIKILEDLKETLEESLQISNEVSENLLAGDQVILTSIMHQQEALVT